MSLQDCLKSRTTGTTAGRDATVAFWHSFILRLCRMWSEGSLYNGLYILRGSSRIRRSISHQPSSDFRPVRPYRLRNLLCPDRGGGDDVKTANDDPLGLNNQELMNALIIIAEEFHRHGVRCEVFGSLFPRHQSLYSKRINRLNKLLRKHSRCEYYKTF